MPELPQLVYSVDEAADMLRIGRATLYRAIDERRVPHRKMINGQTRLTRDDVDRILADALVPPAADAAAVEAPPGP